MKHNKNNKILSEARAGHDCEEAEIVRKFDWKQTFFLSFASTREQEANGIMLHRRFLHLLNLFSFRQSAIAESGCRRELRRIAFHS